MLRKILISLGLLAITAVAGGALYMANFFGFIFVELDDTPPSLPANLERPAILVFSKANGFVHTDALPAANAMLATIARKNGWSLFQTENGAVMSTELLSKFDAVVWNNTSGTTLTREQRAAFKNYLEGGGGFVGLHAAGGDPWYSWKWYANDLIGTQFVGHTMDPHFQQAALAHDGPENSITNHLPERWLIEAEEWYAFDSNVRTKGYDVLLTLDESSYLPGRATMGEDHPIVWRNTVGSGRAFYSAIGHQAATYSLPAYVELIEKSIRWSAGLDRSN